MLGNPNGCLGLDIHFYVRGVTYMLRGVFREEMWLVRCSMNWSEFNGIERFGIEDRFAS